MTRWHLLTPDSSLVDKLCSEAQLSPMLAHLLALRGIGSDEAAAYLSPSLDQLHSPSLMLGMKEAVERLSAAILHKEQILIYGDYDVDGTTAVVRSEEHTSELQSRQYLVCRLLLEKKKKKHSRNT